MLIVVAVIAVLVAGLFIFTQVHRRRLERRYPPLGEFVDLGGYRLHVRHVPAGEAADLPPIVFIHGASGNLRDQMRAFEPALKGRGDLFFIDRPGHGYSDRGPAENGRPDGQARAVATLLRAKGVDRAVIVGHSLGCGVAANFGFSFPDLTVGLVFLAPATHPWPGGVAWYNTFTRRPLVGRLFANLIALPAGLAMIGPGIAGVFAPNPVPSGYDETAPALALRPRAFRANAIDLADLHPHVVRTHHRYREIAAPTVIVTGDSDDVVLPDLHARGLHRDIAGSHLVWLANVGHKPDYVANDLAVAAIEHVAGKRRDLDALARAVEARVGGDDRPATAAPLDQMPPVPSAPI